MKSPRPTIGFQDLPIELRNKIYFYSIEDTPALKISPVTGGQWIRGVSNIKSWTGHASWLQNLYKCLPACLNLNRKIRQEAIEELQFNAMHIVKTIILAKPEDLLSIIPPATHLSNLRHLIFAEPQRSYDASSASSSHSIYDLVSRCPHLEQLTIPVSITFFQDYDQASFGRLFKHKNLSKLNVVCIDAPVSGRTGDPDVASAQPFERWFLQEGEETGRRIGLSIDLSGTDQHYENVRVEVGCITHVAIALLFG